MSENRRMTWDERFDELEKLGRPIWDQLPEERREQHQIDRQRLSQGTQCVCTCGEGCLSWVAHLQDVREHAELWDRLEREAMPRRWMIGAGVSNPSEECANCEHEYGRHLVGLDGCADCEKYEPEHARCTEWKKAER